MIGKVMVSVSAAHPDMPLREVPVFKGSSATIGVVGVAPYFGGVAVSGVSVSFQNTAGATRTVEATRGGGMWVATSGGDWFAVPGHVRNGLTVTAHGTDETGAARSWTLGRGDLCVISGDGVPVPGETWTNVHLRDEVPEKPQVGDLAKNGDAWLLYTGTAWESLGGGGGTTDYDELENKPGINGVELRGNKTAAQLSLVKTDDSRLTDARTPTAHASTHAKGARDQLTAQDIGALPLEKDLPNGRTVVFVAADGEETTAATMYINAAGDAEAAMHVGDTPGGRGKISVANGPGGEGVGVFGKTYGEVKVAEHDGVSAVEISGSLDIDSDSPTPHGSINVWGEDASIRKNNREVVTEDQLPTKVSQLTNDSGFMTPADVVPKGSGTEVIATIGGKEIKAPAGGGGAAKCLLHFSTTGNSSQYVEWTSGGHTYRLGASDARLAMWKDGVQVTTSPEAAKSTVVPVEGSVLIHDDGYGSDSFAMLDYEQISTTGGAHDTTGKSAMFVQLVYCLEQSTLITMAAGTQKPIRDLKIGDQVLALDPETGELVADEVTDTDAGTPGTHSVLDVWTFEDGTVLKTVHPHQFYNVRTGCMEYIADFRAGDKVRKLDGSETALVSHETVPGVVFHNTLFTRRLNNYYANGVLTGNRKSVRWGWYWRQQKAGE